VSKIQLGRDLGAAIDIDPAMMRNILKKNGSVMYISSVRPLTQDEVQSPTEKKEREEFDIAIEKKFGPSMNKSDLKDDPDYADFVTPTYDCYEDYEVSSSKMPEIDDIKEEHDVVTHDQYVGAHVRVPIGNDIRSGKVVRHKRDLDDTVRGRANANSMLDTRTYEIECPDGRSDEYTANVIAENMYAHCDIDGRQYTLMEGIVDHKNDGHAVEPADMYIKHGSNNKLRKTTKGWNLCVEWKYGTTRWERLVDLKESNPVEVAEYAAAKSFLDTPAFVWWDPHLLKKRSIIITAVTKRYHKRTHKFGIEVPKNWDDCVRLDKENDNTLWQDAARKEMKNVRISFKIINGEESAPPTYQDIRCHMIFYVKMEDFRRKARFVAGCHTTDTPHAMTYANVVSREYVRVALTLTDLNDLDVKMADIENVYLMAPLTEKVWTVLGPEFGDDAGKLALIVRALYGLKSAGTAFSNHLAECMKHSGWKPCCADRDLWMMAETRPDDGVLYWAYILIYVDDILCVHHDPSAPLEKLDKYFKMKEGSIQVPTFYLGANLKKTVLPNGVVAWGTSSIKYVQSAVHNVYLAALPGNQKLPKKVSGPFAGGYKPDLDESPELDPTRANC
jgi:hypothetical protein